MSKGNCGPVSSQTFYSHTVKACYEPVHRISHCFSRQLEVAFAMHFRSWLQAEVPRPCVSGVRSRMEKPRQRRGVRTPRCWRWRQPLSAPAVRPCTRNRRTRIEKNSTGSMTMVPPAAILPHSQPS
jgi:hypothetical protein